MSCLVEELCLQLGCSFESAIGFLVIHLHTAAQSSGVEASQDSCGSCIFRLIVRRFGVSLLHLVPTTQSLDYLVKFIS